MSAVPDPAPAGPVRAQPDEEPADEFVTALDRPTEACAVLSVEGEVDAVTAPALGDALNLLLAEPARTLVVDLTGVTFLASSGLAVLIGARRTAEEQARTLRLVTAGRPVLRVMEITGADQLFDIHPTADDALAASD